MYACFTDVQVMYTEIVEDMNDDTLKLVDVEVEYTTNVSSANLAETHTIGKI